MHLPQRGDFEFTIKYTQRIFFLNIKRKIVLKYKQANIAEVQDFLKFKNNQDWFVYFLKEMGIKEKEINLILISKEYLGIFTKIKDTYFRKVFQTIKETEVIKTEYDEIIKTDEAEEAGFVGTVCKGANLNGSTYSIDLTQEQFNWFARGVVFNINAGSKEGEKRNEQNFRKHLKDNETTEDKARDRRLQELLDNTL